MRAEEFISEEQKLDEVLPLVGLAAKAAGGMLARGAAKTAGGMLARGAAKTAGGMLARGAAKAAGGAVKGIAKAAGVAAKPPSAGPQTIGAPDSPAASIATQDPKKNQAIDKAKDQVIRPGANINLPTAGTGGTGEFKITGIQGDEVEIENPRPTPGEPTKTVYKKDDIKRSMSL